MSDKDPLGDRMKFYERIECGRKFMPLLPIVARIDGKCFSGLTKPLDRPYDERFSEIMRKTTRLLVEETGAKIGYQQSDEITLVFNSDDMKTQVYFNGKIQKMVSILASAATAYFNSQNHPKIKKLGMFDARAWIVPNKMEATNAILWRESDATKNSVSMAARAYYSHNQIHGKTSAQMQEMLFEKGVNWNDYPDYFKRGSYFQKKKTKRTFTSEEIESLPEKHAAKLNPDLVVERTEIRNLDMPIFSKIANRIGVVFYGEDPIVEQ